jgi:hypothetical protein
MTALELWVRVAADASTASGQGLVVNARPFQFAIAKVARAL